MTVIRPWHASEQLLKYQISDLTIGRRRLHVLACELGPDLDAPRPQIPPTLPLDSNMSGYVLRGVPASNRSPLIEVRDRYLIYRPHRYQRYFINLRQSFEDYAGGFRSKTRGTIRRKVRKFATHCGGDIDFRTYKTRTDMKAFHAAARRVSALTYQEGLLDAGLPAGEHFADQLCTRAERDQVRGYILYFGDNPISYVLLGAVDDVLVYEFLGYDPAYRKWSIGTVLHWLMLEDILQERQFRMLDFTEGEGEQKRQFATGSLPCENIFCLKDSLTTRCAIYLHAATDRVSSLGGRLLDKLGLRSRLRNLIRGTT